MELVDLTALVGVRLTPASRTLHLRFPNDGVTLCLRPILDTAPEIWRWDLYGYESPDTHCQNCLNRTRR